MKKFSVLLSLLLMMIFFYPAESMARNEEKKKAPAAKTALKKAKKSPGKVQDKRNSRKSSAPEIQSAILMNMNNGRILYEENADKPLQPASLTKVLSLFLTYEAMGKGKVCWMDPVLISSAARQADGSRMYVEAGERVPLEVLIKGMTVISANDASVAVAEHVAGNVDRFVERMNHKAAELGMKSSAFRNPNGLPAEGQYTTARDMLILANAYLHRFPGSLALHSMRFYRYKNITQHNCNALLQKYPGVDGLKSGFVRAAGYHLIVTARRGNTRLIAVVMGARNPEIRVRECRKLLDIGFQMLSADSGGHTTAAERAFFAQPRLEKVPERAIKARYPCDMCTHRNYFNIHV
ncbi:MAG: D-alanyl-D-alanine carboxypeptidase DacF precursor [Syntrophus sp. PtaU1.Bin005]|jgi:D-alanyl-D-alanine carboxypeptidase (penicillin-binding protein 5/6)|uniref:D-alanyl-D-alanine carboxypeptidase family protein n=1 Tax=Syntrophus buswellii TaxID=43774 RepID=UPI0009D0AECD|nr:MAG: D-alanyl-D-alanine carboxypeptidase DacF precursor [Syntrophus sp. PtaB.Bin138]OPY81140.1 MAG: D-alanyl-D-alanine carboxypeptidase DacF precursor [Syntrophus sp. PtaU1.Bin005]